MPTTTTNYGWSKPALTDPANITVLNTVIDAIDAVVGAIVPPGGFTESQMAAAVQAKLDNRAGFATWAMLAGVHTWASAAASTASWSTANSFTWGSL